MPKFLIFVLLFAFLALIFAPKALILAQERSLDNVPTSYLPPGGFQRVISQIPGRFVSFLAIGLPGVIKNTMYDISNTKIYKNLKIYFVAFFQALGEIFSFIGSLLIKFYKFLYP